MGLFKSLFGEGTSRELKAIYPIVDKIEALADEYKAMTDKEFDEAIEKIAAQYDDKWVQVIEVVVGN